MGRYDGGIPEGVQTGTEAGVGFMLGGRLQETLLDAIPRGKHVLRLLYRMESIEYSINIVQLEEVHKMLKDWRLRKLIEEEIER